MDLSYERRMGDMRLITSNNHLIWAWKSIKQKRNGQEVHPITVLMVPLSVSMADPKQGDKKYEENNMASQSGHVPQTKGPSPGHRWTWIITLPLQVTIATVSSLSHLPVKVPICLTSSLHLWAQPASRDTFRHVPVSCTSCTLAACTLFVSSPLPARQLNLVWEWVPGCP